MAKLIFFGLFFLSSTASFSNAEALPVEFFGSIPDVSRMQLSPSGYKLASKIKIDTPEKKGTAIQVVNLETSEKKLVLFTDDKTFSINWIKWKGNSTLLVGIYFSENRAEKNTLARYKAREYRLLIVDLDTGKYHEALNRAYITSLASFGYDEVPLELDDVVDILDDDPDHILMSVMQDYYIVIKVNIHKQSTSIIQSAQPGVWKWQTDQQKRVRIANYYDYLTAINKIFLIAPDRSDWKELWQFLDYSENEVTVLGFGADPNIIYINAYLNGKLAVFKVNLKDPNLKRELVLSNPDYDVTGELIVSPVTKDVIGIREWSSRGVTFIEPSFTKLMKGLNSALPQTNNYLVNLSNDERRYLLLATNETDAGTYYIGNRDKGSLDPVALRYKNLNNETMASKQKYRIKTRDGLEVDAYLTTPKGKELSKLPLIVMPHDGPMFRNDDQVDDIYLNDEYTTDTLFSIWPQFFANRGYAVLQVNFRGSPDKGLAFQALGFGQWGKSMQEDIEDSVYFLIAQGIVDKEKIGAFGIGYGGYSAVWGTVKTPELYKAAISVGGFFDVNLYAYDRKPFWLTHNWVKTVFGNTKGSLKEISPYFYVNKITAPLLLIHGDVDRRVKPEYSRTMVEALRKNKNKFEYVELIDEDHFISDNMNRLKTFKAIDEFLAKNLSTKIGK